MGGREIGIVRWYDSDEGYGFIARKSGEDIYVSARDIHCNNGDCILNTGDPVEFSVVDSDNGLQARSVIILK